MKDADDRGTGRGRLLEKLGTVAKDFNGKRSEIDEMRAKEGALTFWGCNEATCEEFHWEGQKLSPHGPIVMRDRWENVFQNQDKTKTWLEFDFLRIRMKSKSEG